MQISGRGIAQGPDAAIPTLLEFNRMRVEGGLAFEQRPYVVMADNAWVDLGVLEGPLASRDAVAVVQ